MASLFELGKSRGIIVSVGGDEKLHRRLVDMGLIGASCFVKAKRRGGALVDYGDFSAVTRDAIAKQIEIVKR